MYTNVKINPKLKEVLGRGIVAALAPVPVATVELRDSLNTFDEALHMFKGLDRESQEFKALLEDYVVMLQDAVSYEDHETLPDDFLDNYKFNANALNFGITLQKSFWETTGEGSFTCDDKLTVVDGGKTDA